MTMQETVRIDRDEMVKMVKMARDDEFNSLAYMMAGLLSADAKKQLDSINEKWEPIINLIRTAPEPEELKRLVDAASKMPSACSTLMDEVVGKKATDWGLVNDSLCNLTAALAPFTKGEK